MKHPLKTLATALAILNSPFSILNSSAAVPVAWTNTPAATQPYPLKPVPHGVPINFRVTLKGYTEPLIAPGADLHLWYQTNGMGSAWWSAPATLEGDVITATFGPAQDTGADRVSLFFGAPSNVFASAVLRLTHSPGFAPASLPLPTPVLDFAAVELRNISALTNGWSFGGEPADYETVSNRAMSALQQHQSLMPATIYADEATNALSRAMRDKSDLAVYKVQTNYTDWVFSDGQTRDVIIIEDSPYPDLPWLITGSDYNSLPYMESFHPTREAAEAALEFSYPLYDNTSGEYVDIIATREACVTMVQNGRIATRTDATAAAAAAVLPIEQEIADMRAENSLIYRLYSGSNVVCEVTNYNSRVNPPTLRLLQLTETNTYITIWAETNGLERTARSAAAYTDSSVAELEARAREAYAPRGWSGTTSGLGAPAPSNTTWISTPTTVFAGGLEYEKQVTTFGQIWILSYHGDTPQVYTNQASNITLMSADGTEAFAVEKTDSYLVGVDPTSIHVNGNTVTMAVPVVAETHPYLRYTQALSPLAWEREENGFTTDISVTWSGSSGAWVCMVTTSARQGFFAFEFFQEGGVKVTSKGTFDIPDGILCTDGVHKCRPVFNNGTITWEAFQ